MNNAKKMVETALKKKFQLLVYRQEGMTTSQFTLVNAVVNGEKIQHDEELVAALKAGVTRWVKETDEGKAAYKYAGDDMNIGDLGTLDLLIFGEILYFCPDIYELDFQFLDEMATDHWNYDTRLCERIEELEE
jgi:hypothetical protein